MKRVILAVGIACLVFASNVFAVLSGGGTQTNPYLIQSRGDFDEFANPANAAIYWTSGVYTKLMCDVSLAGTTYTQAPIASGPSTTFAGIFDGNGYVVSNLTINGGPNRYIGLFGYVDTGGQIYNVGVEKVNIIGNLYTGGLVGYMSPSTTITSCHVTGSVRGTLDYVGGLVGYKDGGSLTACYATSSVSVTGSESFYFVGGLVGNNDGPINSCYATGPVSGKHFVGGLTGWNDGSITSCYATGSVSGVQDVGGLVGADFAALNFCYATGSVSGVEDVGGLTGSVTYGTVTGCFWDVQTSGTTVGVGRGASTGVTGKSTAEMKTLSTFTSAEWDFSETDGDPADWQMPTNSYPRLAWEGCSGTQTNPYLIRSRADFDDFVNPANAALYWASGKYTKLMCDIDLSGTTYTQAVIAPDTSTSSGFQGTKFTGIFEGNGHKISNLTITANGKDYIGLFGCVGSGGQIRNLGVEFWNVNVTNSDYVGGLVGFNEGSLITGCYTTGSVRGLYYVGGLVGWNDSGNITFCYSTTLAGGLGGVSSSVGGLIGYIYSGTLTSCYATGAVTGDGYVGGLAGSNWFGTFTACYATGAITGNSYVGGLLGSNTSGSLSSCYSAGSVRGTSKYFIGGLVGENSGTLTGCFWDKDTSGQPTSAGGTSKTDIQMKTLSTFTNAGWDFSATDGDPADWMLKWPGEDYPRLPWQTVVWQPVDAGDIDHDRNVDFFDFARLATSWLTICSESSWCEGADINRNGAVNYDDVILFANNWLWTYHMLSVSVVGGNGAVAPSSLLYPKGTVVTLTAAPNSGYKVKAWHGTDNDSSKSITNTVTMNSDKEVTVEFELITYYQLNTSVISGSGSISPSSQQYPEGTTVTLTAAPSSSYSLKAWHGTDNDSSKSTTNTVTMNSNKNVTVEFEYTIFPNGGFEMGDFTYWTPSGGVFIDISLTEGNYSAVLNGGTLSRTINLPSYGNYTFSFDYAYYNGGGYAYVLINGQQYSLNADEQVHTFTQNLLNISSFTIQFLTSGDAFLMVDKCAVVNCFNCQMNCNYNGYCEPWEQGTGCPDCQMSCNYNGYCEPWEGPSCLDCGLPAECGNWICEPGEEGWCEDCFF